MNVLIKPINGSVSLLIYVPRIERSETRERKKRDKLIEITRMACTSLDTIPFTSPFWFDANMMSPISELYASLRVVSVATCEIEQLKYAEYSNLFCKVCVCVCLRRLVEGSLKTKCSAVNFNAIDRALRASRKMCHRKSEHVYGFPNMCFKWIFGFEGIAFVTLVINRQQCKAWSLSHLSRVPSQCFFFFSFVRHWETSTMLTWSECSLFSFVRSFVRTFVFARSLYVFL